jgi:hypothetical protein
MACEDTAAGLRACGGGAAGRARASWRGEGRSGTLREACRSCHRVDNSDGVKDKEQLDYVRLGLSCWLGHLGPCRLAISTFFLYVVYLFFFKKRESQERKSFGLAI